MCEVRTGFFSPNLGQKLDFLGTKPQNVCALLLAGNNNKHRDDDDDQKYFSSTRKKIMKKRKWKILSISLNLRLEEEKTMSWAAVENIWKENSIAAPQNRRFSRLLFNLT